MKNKRKNIKRIKQAFTEAHGLRNALILGDRLGEEEGAYRRCLCLADEAAI